MITAWDQVKIAENDDVGKLLAGRKSAFPFRVILS